MNSHATNVNNGIKNKTFVSKGSNTSNSIATLSSVFAVQVARIEICVIKLLPNCNENYTIAVGHELCMRDKCRSTKSNKYVEFIARLLARSQDNERKKIDKLNILILRKHNSLTQHNNHTLPVD